jgi:Tol biopolymer transport system component
MWINTQVWVAPVDGSPPQLVDTTSGSMPVGWSADGRYLTADSGVTAIDVIDMITGSATTVVTSTNDVHLSAADWAGSGTRFAFVGERSASYRH